jgi:hypothetical protein
MSHSSIFSNSSVSSPCEIEVERVETEFEASHGGHVDGNSDEEEANLVPRAFARFRGSGTGSKGPGKHWSRVSKNIGHFVII